MLTFMLCQNRVIAQGPGILEAEHANISCAPLSVSLLAHFLLLDYVHEVIVFMSNGLVAQ